MNFWRNVWYGGLIAIIVLVAIMAFLDYSDSPNDNGKPEVRIPTKDGAAFGAIK